MSETLHNIQTKDTALTDTHLLNLGFNKNFLANPFDVTAVVDANESQYDQS